MKKLTTILLACVVCLLAIAASEPPVRVFKGKGPDHVVMIGDVTRPELEQIVAMVSGSDPQAKEQLLKSLGTKGEVTLVLTTKHVKKR